MILIPMRASAGCNSVGNRQNSSALLQKKQRLSRMNQISVGGARAL